MLRLSRLHTRGQVHLVVSAVAKCQHRQQSSSSDSGGSQSHRSVALRPPRPVMSSGGAEQQTKGSDNGEQIFAKGESPAGSLAKSYFLETEVMLRNLKKVEDWEWRVAPVKGTHQPNRASSTGWGAEDQSFGCEPSRPLAKTNRSGNYGSEEWTHKEEYAHRKAPSTFDDRRQGHERSAGGYQRQNSTQERSDSFSGSQRNDEYGHRQQDQRDYRPSGTRHGEDEARLQGNSRYGAHDRNVGRDDHRRNDRSGEGGRQDEGHGRQMRDRNDSRQGSTTRDQHQGQRQQQDRAPQQYRDGQGQRHQQGRSDSRQQQYRDDRRAVSGGIRDQRNDRASSRGDRQQQSGRDGFQQQRDRQNNYGQDRGGGREERRQDWGSKRQQQQQRETGSRPHGSDRQGSRGYQQKYGSTPPAQSAGRSTGSGPGAGGPGAVPVDPWSDTFATGTKSKSDDIRSAGTGQSRDSAHQSHSTGQQSRRHRNDQTMSDRSADSSVNAGTSAAPRSYVVSRRLSESNNSSSPQITNNRMGTEAEAEERATTATKKVDDEGNGFDMEEEGNFGRRGWSAAKYVDVDLTGEPATEGSAADARSAQAVVPESQYKTAEDQKISPARKILRRR